MKHWLAFIAVFVLAAVVAGVVAPATGTREAEAAGPAIVIPTGIAVGTRIAASYCGRNPQTCANIVRGAARVTPPVVVSVVKKVTAPPPPPVVQPGHASTRTPSGTILVRPGTFTQEEKASATLAQEASINGRD